MQIYISATRQAVISLLSLVSEHSDLVSLATYEALIISLSLVATELQNFSLWTYCFLFFSDETTGRYGYSIYLANKLSFINIINLNTVNGILTNVLESYLGPTVPLKYVLCWVTFLLQIEN